MGSSASSAIRPAHPDNIEQKALVFNSYGGEVVVVNNIPKPVLTDNKSCLIKVYSSSLNPIDASRVNGALKRVRPEPYFPAVIGYDAAGVIEEIGSEVNDFKVGDEIMVRIVTLRPGSICEYFVANANQLSLKPKNISFNEAASLPLAGVTALQILKRGKVKEGDKVLITGGAGGVGTLAIQLAKHVFKAGTVATTASPGVKTDLVKQLGADIVINYKEQQFEDVLKDYDFAFDCTHESHKMPQILKKGGSVCTIADAPTVQSLEEIGMKLNFIMKFFISRGENKVAIENAKKYGVNWAFVLLQPNGKDLSELGGYVEQGLLKPVIDNVWPIDNAVDAYKKLVSGRSKGKCIIQVVDTKDNEKKEG